jgi:uncharacterized protein (TIGR03083 family)
VHRHALLDALARETAAFAAVLESADLRAPVAACPGWDLTGLAAHLAGVHRWARNAVAEHDLREVPAPALVERRDVVEDYRASAVGLLDALRAAPAGTPCPGFGPRPRTVEFWVRRQPHETAVHRWDAETAAGGRPALDPALSADGVAEVLDVMLPRQVRLERVPPPVHPVVLARTDGPERWVLGEGEPVATVHAEASTLLLLLWRRRTVDDAAVEGDAQAARQVLAGALTP